MFDDVLIESAGKDKQKGGWITALISMAVHLAVIGGLVVSQIAKFALQIFYIRRGL